MIKQVIVVEGKSDIARVHMAVDADIIATGGLALKEDTLKDIKLAYEKRGIIILTDPDGPGEKIRRFLTRLFPKALHAFVPKKQASTKDDVGIEDASPEAIKEALSKVRVLYQDDSQEFTMEDLWKAGLAGTADAAEKRVEAGDLLGIGYGNAKQFLKRLNHFGITRQEWDEAILHLTKETK
jgi:ribonuclease M5